MCWGDGLLFLIFSLGNGWVDPGGVEEVEDLASTR